MERGLDVFCERGSTKGRERLRSVVVIDTTDAAPLVSSAYDDGAPKEAISERRAGPTAALRSGHASRAPGQRDAAVAAWATATTPRFRRDL